MASRSPTPVCGHSISALGGAGNNPDALYFTAGINDENDGLFGEIAPTPEPPSLILGGLGILALAFTGLRARILAPPQAGLMDERNKQIGAGRERRRLSLTCGIYSRTTRWPGHWLAAVSTSKSIRPVPASPFASSHAARNHTPAITRSCGCPSGNRCSTIASACFLRLDSLFSS